MCGFGLKIESHIIEMLCNIFTYKKILYNDKKVLVVLTQYLPTQ